MNSPAIYAQDQGLEFLWVELTNRCNLECVHCYADSRATAPLRDKLTDADYMRLISEAADLGCRKVQFIGGEPTLHPSLPTFIKHAKNCGMEFIEVYTNAVRIPDDLLECFRVYQVAVAVSFYSQDHIIHDSITHVAGSCRATVRNLKRIVEAGLSVRAGIVEMDANTGTIDETIKFLNNIGIQSCGADRERAFGRAGDLDPKLTNLCGSCWQGSVCIHPDGQVSPCIMSRSWPVGSVIETPLAEIIRSKSLQSVRERVYNDVWLPHQAVSQEVMKASVKTPTSCQPCDPTCGPRCGPSCQPCWPFGKCRPQTGN